EHDAEDPGPHPPAGERVVVLLDAVVGVLPEEFLGSGGVLLRGLVDAVRHRSFSPRAARPRGLPGAGSRKSFGIGPAGRARASRGGPGKSRRRRRSRSPSASRGTWGRRRDQRPSSSPGAEGARPTSTASSSAGGG